MWNGKMTPEMTALYDEYYEKFGNDPDEYDEISYNGLKAKDYKKAIKKAIAENKELPEVM